MATSKRTNAPTHTAITQNTQKRKSVSNHNTSSPSHGGGGGRPLPTIPDSPSGFLTYLQKIELDEYQFPFDRWDLDEIAKDNVTSHCLYKIDRDGVYMLGFWSHFDWWLRVSENLADCLLCKVGETQVTDEHREFTRRLVDLETSVLSLFPAAHLSEPSFYRENDDKPQLELLKAYRALTQFLSDTAASFWPGDELLWLTNHR